MNAAEPQTTPARSSHSYVVRIWCELHDGHATWRAGVRRVAEERWRIFTSMAAAWHYIEAQTDAAQTAATDVLSSDGEN